MRQLLLVHLPIRVRGAGRQAAVREARDPQPGREAVDVHVLLEGRVGMELRMIVLGGERILKKLHEAQGDVFGHRPKLERGDWVYMVLRALARY